MPEFGPKRCQRKIECGCCRNCPQPCGVLDAQVLVPDVIDVALAAETGSAAAHHPGSATCIVRCAPPLSRLRCASACRSSRLGPPCAAACRVTAAKLEALRSRDRSTSNATRLEPSPCARRTAVIRDGHSARARTGTLFRDGLDAPPANSPNCSAQSHCRPAAPRARAHAEKTCVLPARVAMRSTPIPTA